MRNTERATLLAECLDDKLFRETLIGLRLGKGLSEWASRVERDPGLLSKKMKRWQSQLGVTLTQTKGGKLVLNRAGMKLARSAQAVEDLLGAEENRLLRSVHFGSLK